MNSCVALLPSKKADAVDTKETLAALVAALFGGGWLTQWMKNRGNVQTRQGDEFAKLRAELRADNRELRIRVDEMEKQIFATQLSYAVFREKVRTLIRLFKAGNSDWKTLADDIESEEHDVDAMFEWWRQNKGKAPGD